MKRNLIVIAMALFIAFVPLIGSAATEQPAINGEYLIRADGFMISIDSSYPVLSFYGENATEPVFSISYDELVLYNGDISAPEYRSTLSSSLWDTTIFNSTEEDGTVRTLVSMSSTIDMSGNGEISEWGKLTFNFLILTKGDKAQLGISMNIKDMKSVSDCSHMAIIQSIDGDATFIPDANEVIVSDIYYRWDPTASVNIDGVQEERDVGAQYSEGSLSLIYPYSQDMVEIMHISGKVDLGNTVIMKNYFSDALGYGLGILAGFGLLGISYAVKEKKKKSPFDMDSPIYRK